MTQPDNSVLDLPQGGRIERLLGHPKFQRWFAATTSIAGIVMAMTIIGALFLAPAVTRAVDAPIDNLQAASWATLPGVMHWLEFIMRLLLIFVCGALGAYLALRGKGRPLARLLAGACGAISAGAGLFTLLNSALLGWMIKTLSDPMAFNALVYIVVALFLLIVLLMSVWMFSTVKFLMFFPKPVKLSGLDPVVAYNLPAFRGFRIWWELEKSQWWELTWRWLISPQFLALVTGMVMIVAINVQAESMHTEYATSLGFYYWCWLPFAIVSAKQKHVDEEDGRAIRWVILGQSIWLTVYLLVLALVLVLRFTGILTFPDWTQSIQFTASLLLFLHWGFVIVFLLTLTISILYHGTLDPELGIRRTWLVAVVGIVSGMLFVVFERLLAGLVGRWFDVSAGTSFTLVGAATAICIIPLRAWAEKFIKRTMEKWQAAYLLADGVREAATIVFADLSGYTALTERNEREALIVAAIFHRDANTAAEAHRGRLIKTIGDAVLLRFANADDALAAMRRLIADYTLHATPLVSTLLPVHAGIHHGEVVGSSNGDVYGATVNLASRILDAAGPNEVVASQVAVSNMSPSVRTESIGSRTFKNVENPVTCFRLLAA